MAGQDGSPCNGQRRRAGHPIDDIWAKWRFLRWSRKRVSNDLRTAMLWYTSSKWTLVYVLSVLMKPNMIEIFWCQRVLNCICTVTITLWWRHQIETFSALLALCEGNSPVTGEFPSQRPVTRSLLLPLIWAWTNDWIHNRDAGDLRRHPVH